MKILLKAGKGTVQMICDAYGQGSTGAIHQMTHGGWGSKKGQKSVTYYLNGLYITCLASTFSAARFIKEKKSNAVFTTILHLNTFYACIFHTSKSTNHRDHSEKAVAFNLHKNA